MRDVRQARWPFALAMGLLLLGCTRTVQTALPAATGATPQGNSVSFTLQLPRKLMHAADRTVQEVGGGDGALLINRVNVRLDGPGFFQPIFPPGYPDGFVPVTSASVASRVDLVPSGRNRFLKVSAYNGNEKLVMVGGVVDILPGPYNHLSISLDTTPTQQVLEALSLQFPDVARGFDAAGLQQYLDTYVTKPVLNDPNLQNTFAGLHPYFVNADGIVDYLVANNYVLPTSFNAMLPTFKPFQLQAGDVQVITNGLPVGSRIWCDDPTSAVITTVNPATTVYDLTNVTPNFKPDASETPTWTVTVLTPTGNLVTQLVSVPRKSFVDPVLNPIPVDFRPDLADPNAHINSLILSPSDATWAGGTVTLNGRTPQQIFAFAKNGLNQTSPIVPSALDWTSLDPTVLQVGNGTILTAGSLPDGLATGASNVAGLNAKDYGLVFPLTETTVGSPVSVRATLHGTSISALLPFQVAVLGDTGSRLGIDIQADDIHIVQGAGMTIVPEYGSVPLTVVENAPPAGTTYRWVSDNPALVVTGNSSTATLNASSTVAQPAHITVYSTTGRKATIQVGTSTSNARVDGGVTINGAPISLKGLSATNPLDDDLSPGWAPDYWYYQYDGQHEADAYLNKLLGKADIEGVDALHPNDATFYWTSDNPKVISVSGSATPTRTAKLTAYLAGYATITATAPDGRTAIMHVSSGFTVAATVAGAISIPGDLRFVALGTSNFGNAALAGDDSINSLGGQVKLEATDGGHGALYSFVSSNPGIIATGGGGPALFTNLTAVSAGTVTITAIATDGRRISRDVTARFTRPATVSGTITINSGTLTLQGNPTPTAIAQSLSTAFLAKPFTAVESDYSNGTYNWISSDPSVLKVLPPAGHVFPYGSAQLEPLRNGDVTLALVGVETGRVAIYRLQIRPDDTQAVAGSFQVPVLQVTQTLPVAVPNPDGLIHYNAPGDRLTLSATDASDASPHLSWSSSDPSVVKVISMAGNTAQVVILKQGRATIQVTNLDDDRRGSLGYLVQGGQGQSNVTVTL